MLEGFFPDWTDPATGAKSQEQDSALIQSYVQDNGFTDGEFSQLKSAKVMHAIFKAAKFDALKNESDVTAKQVRKAPKAIKPSAKKVAQKSTSTVEQFYGRNYTG